MRPVLRVAAVDFLNPAPLMWNFEHPPQENVLAATYEIERMSPAACATALAESRAEIGLIPVGAYATIPGLAIVPGCAIASLGAIRSLLLVFRSARNTPASRGASDRESNPSIEAAGRSNEADLQPPTPEELARIHTVALDTASRTTALYTQILFRRFWQHTPRFLPHAPVLDEMLATADAAVLIGDPALLALRDRAARQARTGEQLRYLDLGAAWREATGTAWISAFWAIRQAGVANLTRAERSKIVTDLIESRDAGLRHIPELVREWAPRLGLSAPTVEHYLTRNIYYHLDAPVVAGLQRFYTEAYALDLLPLLPRLAWFHG